MYTVEIDGQTYTANTLDYLLSKVGYSITVAQPKHIRNGFLYVGKNKYQIYERFPSTSAHTDLPQQYFDYVWNFVPESRRINNILFFGRLHCITVGSPEEF